MDNIIPGFAGKVFPTAYVFMKQLLHFVKVS
jgi:hypothetical protein